MFSVELLRKPVLHHEETMLRGFSQFGTYLCLCAAASVGHDLEHLHMVR